MWEKSLHLHMCFWLFSFSLQDRIHEPVAKRAAPLPADTMSHIPRCQQWQIYDDDAKILFNKCIDIAAGGHHLIIKAPWVPLIMSGLAVLSKDRLCLTPSPLLIDTRAVTRMLPS